ncbi:hypothetical protein D6C91_08602 [Aureobasidium pullulans]|uniref:Uncharacterized protein n=1 Tax=Aureobasidium pullulans TaxID=5580 RepID=A0A4S9SPK6_AURPU|nr:hypothetical protein D6C91_08602 [Aureobasidium pullulans]
MARRFGIDAYREINGNLEDSITDGDIKSMKKHGNELQGLLEVFEEDAILDDGGLAIDLLTKALKCIKAHHGAASLAVHTLCGRIGEGKGLGKLPNDRITTWYRQDDNWDIRPMSALRMLVEAAKRSECPVNEFEFGVAELEQVVKSELSTNLAVVTASDAFAGLKSFDIDIESAHAAKISEDLAKILPLAKSISGFKLAATTWVGDEMFQAGLSSQQIANILDSVSSDTLRLVKFRNFVCEQEELRRFLDRHNSTIKELSFTSVVVLGSWDELLEWIGANLHLEKLELKALGTMDENASNDENGGDFPVKWACPEVLQGEEQVRLGLMEILEKKRSADDKRLHDEEEGEREESEEIEEVEEIEEIEEVEDEIPV